MVNKTKQRFGTKIKNRREHEKRQREIRYDGVADMMYRKKAVTGSRTTFMIILLSNDTYFTNNNKQ